MIKIPNTKWFINKLHYDTGKQNLRIRIDNIDKNKLILVIKLKKRFLFKVKEIKNNVPDTTGLFNKMSFYGNAIKNKNKIPINTAIVS